MSESEYDSSESPAYLGGGESPESEEEEEYERTPGEEATAEEEGVKDGMAEKAGMANPAELTEVLDKDKKEAKEVGGIEQGESMDRREEQRQSTEEGDICSDDSDDEVGRAITKATKHVTKLLSDSEEEQQIEEGREEEGEREIVEGGGGEDVRGVMDVWSEEGGDIGGRGGTKEGDEEEVFSKEGDTSLVDTGNVFADVSDDEVPATEQREGEEEEEPPARKRARIGGDSEEEEEGEEEGDELAAEVAELQAGIEESVGPAEVEVGNEEEGSDDEPPDNRSGGTSDWDLMMQRRKEAMARARRRRKNYDVTLHDDEIMAMIQEMKHAAEEDRRLNMARRPATKKLQMLPTVISHLKKSDLQTSFIECGILTALADWLQPLPDHSLPHLKIREGILSILRAYPTPDSGLLKSSKIGKAVMLLYRHPKETKRNKEVAGKMINDWARPIFGLASDFKTLSRDEREERDYEHLSQAARRRLSSSSEKKGASEEEYEPQRPGDRGWVGRARVPMPSTKDYVVRPKWNVEQEFKKSSGKKLLNRYEKQVQKHKQKRQMGSSTHAVSISIEGRNMPL